MENASNALYIAGGVLIAILILSLLVLMWSGASGLFKSDEELKEEQQVAAFNTDYEAFNKNLLRGTEIISVINKAESNNRKYTKVASVPTSRAIKQDEMSEEGYYIEIRFILKDSMTIGSTTLTIDIEHTQDAFYRYINSNSEAFKEFKRKIFDCTKTEYNTTTGRINCLVFTENLEAQTVE